MTDDLHPHERALFARLNRTADPPDGEAERLLAELRRGALPGRTPHTRTPRASRPFIQAAAALALFAVGLWAGGRLERRSSLEGMLARTELPMAERVLLLQRTGSAYVRAAHAYAAATAATDSTAVEVASQVLRGAARALQKTTLESPLSNGLVTVLRATDVTRAQPILWY